MAILEEALRHLEGKGIGSRRIARLRLDNYFTVVELDDGMVGACMSYYFLDDTELQSARQGLESRLASDPLLLDHLFSDRTYDPLRQSLRATVVSALSSSTLRRGGDAGFAATSSPPRPPFEGISKAMVIGFGGYMDRLARDPGILRLHIADLGYHRRREQMDAEVARYRRERPELSMTVSDGADTPVKIHDFELVCITGSALSNGTLEGLLEDAALCRRVIVQGQSASIHPRALFERGVDLVATTIKPRNLVELTDRGILPSVLEGGLPPVYLWCRPHRTRSEPPAIPDDEEGWWRRFADRFGENGYSAAPKEVYRPFLEVVDRPGKILELGCGNGLLLRYLVDHSPHRLLPAGIDSNAGLIEAAKSAIFPESVDAFRCGDLRSRHLGGTYSLVIANPLYADRGYYEQKDGLMVRLYADGSIARFVLRCYEHLEPGGRLVLFCYSGQLGEIAPFRAGFDQELSTLPFETRPSSTGRVTFFVVDRPA